MDLSYICPPSLADVEAIFAQAPSPCYVVDGERIRRNGEVLAHVQRESGCKVLLALKGFAMFRLFPLLRQYLCGTSASGIYEALLGFEHFGGEVHAYSPAFNDEELTRLLRVSDHLVFNTPGQWQRYRKQVEAAPRKLSCGLRVNPGCSKIEIDLYNPCAPSSRLGTPASQLSKADLEGLEGLHFHALCEQNVDALEAVLEAFEAVMAPHIAQMRWVNFGGGHHITRPDYDVGRLIELVGDFRKRYPGVDVYLEPGEAVALDAGYLVATVLDVLQNDKALAILNVSATCHMPDVLEMPYRPQIAGAGEQGEKAHLYRLGGPSCLAGDIIGDYAFDALLKPGDRLLFLDMAHYTMVKNTTFNGVPLPAIAIYDSKGKALEVVKRFGYADYRDRLS